MDVDAGEEAIRKKFLSRLLQFMEERGTPITRLPRLGQKNLDLFLLYKEVTNHGGFRNVLNNRGLWSSIVAKFHFPSTCTNPQYMLRVNYEKYLLSFEQEKYSGKDGNETPFQTHKTHKDFGVGGSATVQDVCSSPEHDLSHEPFNNVNKLPDDQEVIEACRMMRSVQVVEQDMALKVLLRKSFSKEVFLEKTPGLIDALFERLSKEIIQETFVPGDHIIEELNYGIDSNGQRGFITAIICNLSHLKYNQVFLASHSLIVPFLFGLLKPETPESLLLDGLDSLSCISKYIFIEEFRLCKVWMQRVFALMCSIDRNVALTAVRCMTGLLRSDPSGVCELFSEALFRRVEELFFAPHPVARLWTLKLLHAICQPWNATEARQYFVACEMLLDTLVDAMLDHGDALHTASVQVRVRARLALCRLRTAGTCDLAQARTARWAASVVLSLSSERAAQHRLLACQPQLVRAACTVIPSVAGPAAHVLRRVAQALPSAR